MLLLADMFASHTKFLTDSLKPQTSARARFNLHSPVQTQGALSISQYSKISTLVFQGEEKLRYMSEGMKREESKAKELEIVIKVRWRNKNLFIFLFLN